METIVLWTGAYLLGSIPFGVLLARMRNVDLREHGSGNIGATNVARVLGKKAGILTLLGDLLKGLAAVWGADQFLQTPLGIAAAGLMAFLGHVYSVFLGFKGGKGVATGLGVFVYMMPRATLAAMGVFIITLWMTGYVSLGSILAAIFLPLMGIFFQFPAPFIYVSVIVALIILHKHLPNLRRILHGTEARFLKK
ncbi:MAG: glycerol-3-phosphate 1-O-acyltransferase PlsY [Nitrospinaceae bacterium]